MAESSTDRTSGHAFEKVRGHAQVIRGWAEQTLLWKVWDRMLETEFIDRSIALAGKAFISFFPLIIVVAAFMPPHLRMSILTTVTHRLGITGRFRRSRSSRRSPPQRDIRRATGVLGLVLAVFYAELLHDRAAARLPPRLAPASREGGRQLRPGGRLGGGIPRLLGAAGWRAQCPGERRGDSRFVVAALALSTAMWWFTAWLMLKGQVRFRVRFPGGLITAIALSAYALSSTLWMPNNVTSNNHQYGIFGVALALVAWFSGAVCIIVGACAGPVLAEDPGQIGRLVRGGAASPLVEGALPPLPPPVRSLRLADASP